MSLEKQRLAQIREAFERKGIHPDKNKGQNFLIDGGAYPGTF